MMESAEMIQTTLNLAGVDLIFATGTIKGISQQHLEDISDTSSPYAVIKNAYSFILSATDIHSLHLTNGTAFTVTVFARRYSFVTGPYTEDLTGWALMYVTLTGVTNV